MHYQKNPFSYCREKLLKQVLVLGAPVLMEIAILEIKRKIWVGGDLNKRFQNHEILTKYFISQKEWADN